MLPLLPDMLRTVLRRAAAPLRYSLWRLGLFASPELGADWKLQARLQAQLAGDPLVPGEQLQLHGLTGTVWRGSASSVLLRLPQGYLQLGAVHWALRTNRARKAWLLGRRSPEPSRSRRSTAPPRPCRYRSRAPTTAP